MHSDLSVCSTDVTKLPSEPIVKVIHLFSQFPSVIEENETNLHENCRSALDEILI